MKYLPTPFKKLMGIPCKVSRATLSYFEDEFDLFRRDLEEHFGVAITPEALDQSIRLYNRSRELLEQLYELRKADPPPITGAEVIEVIRAGWIMPREQYNPLLEALLQEVTSKPDRLAGSDSYRLLVYGSELDEPDYLKVIEDLGGMVVADDLCTGSRYFTLPVEEDGNPLRALAIRYLTRPFCARMHPTSERVERLQQLARDFQVEGVIHETIKFCDINVGNYPITKAGLDELGLPSLCLEREYIMAGAGQMKTRVGAFLESLEGRRG
ncbi:MAG: 2-hydroxyacyl-CoA dehydratase [Nitrospinae bacterium]|nr:2-hydroxyacyl-CoA dehydratase [Nitrospinota bacterium]